MVEGVKLRNLHRVGDHGSRTGTTARPHADSLALRPVDVVRNGKEIAREAHLDDDVFLVFGLLAHIIGNTFRKTFLKALLNFFDEPRGLIFPFRNREVRHVRGALSGGPEVDIASLCNFQRRIAGFWQFLPNRAHLFGRTNVVTVSIELKTIRIRDSRTRVDAQQRILNSAVFLFDVVRVVCSDQRCVHELRKFEELFLRSPLEFNPVVHNFHVKILRSENVAQLCGLSHGLVPLPQTHTCLHRTRRATGENNQPLVEAFKQFLISARPLTELSVNRGVTSQAEKVVHSLC